MSGEKGASAPFSFSRSEVMKAKSKNFKPGSEKIPRSSTFSSKKPKFPEHETFGGTSKKK